MIKLDFNIGERQNGTFDIVLKTNLTNKEECEKLIDDIVKGLEKLGNVIK